MTASSLRAEFILLAALWGSSFLFMRLGALEFGVWATAGVRVAVASAFLAPVLWWHGRWPDLRRHARAILFVGLLNSALPFAFYAYAVQTVSTGLAAILNATAPLMGALVAWLWLKDRPGGLRALGLLIGFAGVVLLSWDKLGASAGADRWAVLACLGATLCYGLSASFTKKYLTGVHPLATATGSQFGAALVLAAPALYHWPAALPSAQAWGALLAVGILCTGIAYILFFRLIEHAGPAKAMTVTFLIPVFALLYGALLLGEAVTLRMLLGGGVVLSGVALALGLVKTRSTAAAQPR
jgi:drug/metabolite transporter (DMT)-like permease